MKNRFSTLDEWRGISILFVLAGHLIPLGPSAWHLNSSIAATGMVIFFTLSGFLITNILIKDWIKFAKKLTAKPVKTVISSYQ